MTTAFERNPAVVLEETDAASAPRPRLVANSAMNLVGQSVVLVLAWLTTPSIVNALGPAQYGVLILIFAYIEAFALFDIGIGVGLIKHLAELLPRRATPDVNAYLGTALSLFLGLGSVICVCVVWLAPGLVMLALGPQTELHATVLAAFWIASAAFMARFVGQALAAVPVAAQRFDLANYVTVGSEAFRMGGAVAALAAGYGLEGVVVVCLLANLAAFGANAVIARRLIPGVSFRPRWSREHLVALLHFSKFMIVANIFGRLQHSADKPILSHLLSVQAVAFYSVAYSFGQRLWGVVGSITAVVLPAASVLSRQRPGHELAQLYVRSSKFVAAAVAFPAMALWLFRYELFQHWIGEEFARHASVSLGLLAWGFLANSMAHVPVVVAQAVGRPGIPARFAAINATLTFVLLFALAPRLGIDGAAGGFLTVQLIMTPWFVHTLNRLLGVPWSVLIRRAYLPVGVACALAGLPCWLVRPAVGSLGALLAVVALGLVTYAAAAAAVILEGSERAVLRSPRGLVIRWFATRVRP